MTPGDYDHLRQFLKVRSGLMLSGEKQYLVESRLMPVAREAGLASIGDLVQRLRDPRAAALADRVVEAMTTNETFFFRDKTPFEALAQTLLPALMERRAATKRLRIWCAAASSGQEPYSVAMVLAEMAPRLADWRLEIVATDISDEVLQRARRGVYSQFEVQRGLPIGLLLKHFSQAGDSWQIAPEIRAMVQLRKLNLLDPLTALGSFDIVFCRNVLIYFEPTTKADVLQRIERQLAPDGYLLLGAAETVIGLSDRFKPHPERRGVYVAAPRVPPAPRLSVVSGAA